MDGERDICDDYAALEMLVRDLIAYVDSCDESLGGDGYMDTGEILLHVDGLRAFLKETE